MNRVFSKHNILAPLAGTAAQAGEAGMPDLTGKTGTTAAADEWILVNLLSQEADIIDAPAARLIRDADYSGLDSQAGLVDELVEKGYLVDPDEEASRFRLAYADFREKMDDSEVQVFYVPGYSCNFACDYCYQDGYDHRDHPRQEAVIDAFFSHLDSHLAGRNWYLTLFGGEPLLPGAMQQQNLRQLIAGANSRGRSIAVVTNGYHLEDHIELLKTANLREVQVTLDGLAETHNARRPLKAAARPEIDDNFDRVVRGIDAALAVGFPVNLRMVLDRDNMSELHRLADFAIGKGWTESPNFKTQLGRNYELHFCQDERNRLYSRVEMYIDLAEEIRRHPDILRFHRPAFSITRFLFDTGALPDPLFDSCPGAKTEWAYDYTGNIYACTAMVGKSGEELGTFYPHVALNDEEIGKWEDRDVLSNAGCSSCSLRLACGGGCAAVAKNRSGNLLDTDCRPVDVLISIGVPLYQEMEA